MFPIGTTIPNFVQDELDDAAELKDLAGRS
jgi:hypothetical protein